MTERQLRFHEGYVGRTTLAGGQELILRPLRPDDSRHIVEGLERMSPESVFMRFMGARTCFDERTLRYLCEVDGYDHFALGVATLLADGTERGVAVARLVRLDDEPEVADLAITVIDDYQGRGVGRLLLRRMVQAARERGIERFRCDYWKSNEKVRRLLAVLETHAVIEEDDRSITVELVVPPPSLPERLTTSLRQSPLSPVLKLVPHRRASSRTHRA